MSHTLVERTRLAGSKVRRLSGEQNHRCCYCKLPMRHEITRTTIQREELLPLTPDFVTLEHYVPQSDDGSNSYWNLIVACRMCNGLRSNFPDALAFERIVVKLMTDIRIRNLWHNHHPHEYTEIQRFIEMEFAKRDKGWAFQVARQIA